MAEGSTAFHRHIAEDLGTRYHDNPDAPTGWREIAAWHWEQAHAFAEAIELLLEAAEARVHRLDFYGVRQRIEHTLELLDALEPAQRRQSELRAYVLALAVLEFGGQYREGLNYARHMVRLAQEHHDRTATAHALLAVGRMQRGLSQLASAEVTLQQARELAARESQGELEVEIRLQLAKVHQLQGRHIEALQELQLARESQLQHKNQLKLARVFTTIGDVYQALGANREALLFYKRALGLEQNQSNLLSRAILKEKSALVLLAQAKLPEAQGEIEESLRMRRDVGDIVGQARAHSVLGTILGQLNQHELAIIQHEHAMALDEQTQNQRGQGVGLIHLGDESRALDRYEQAHEYYGRALMIALAISDDVARARVLERIGDLSLVEGHRKAATEYWDEALQLRETMGHADEALQLRLRIEKGYIPRRR